MSLPKNAICCNKKRVNVKIVPQISDVAKSNEPILPITSNEPILTRISNEPILTRISNVAKSNEPNLPRNSIFRNKVSHKKRADAKLTNSVTKTIDQLCDSTIVSKIDILKDCKFIDEQGKVTSLITNSIRANVRSGITVVEVSDKVECPGIYDIVTIRTNKEERDLAKKERETEDLIALKEELNKTQSTEPIIEPTPQPITEPTPQPTTEPTVQAKPVIFMNKKRMIEYKKQLIKKESTQRSRTEAQIRANKPFGNKNTKKFIASLRAMGATDLNDVYYFEVISETTPMVVQVADAFKIDIPLKNSSYYVFFGDMQIKEALMREIDPSYGMNDAIREQTELLERIKNIESTTVNN